MVTYMLSESSEGWVPYDNEGGTALLLGDLNTLLLDAAKEMPENGDSVHGGWNVVRDIKVQILRFLPS